MRFLRVLLGVVVLFLAGITVGGQLWSEEVIPHWLIPLFLLPAAVFLDYCASKEAHSWNILQYSTTGGVLCLIPLAFFLMKSEPFRILFVAGVLIAFYLRSENLVYGWISVWILRALEQKKRKESEGKF
ncbi:hypothetical protein [Nitrospira sp. M1]